MVIVEVVQVVIVAVVQVVTAVEVVPEELFVTGRGREMVKGVDMVFLVMILVK